LVSKEGWNRPDLPVSAKRRKHEEARPGEGERSPLNAAKLLQSQRRLGRWGKTKKTDGKKKSRLTVPILLGTGTNKKGYEGQKKSQKRSGDGVYRVLGKKGSGGLLGGHAKKKGQPRGIYIGGP